MGWRSRMEWFRVRARIMHTLDQRFESHQCLCHSAHGRDPRGVLVFLKFEQFSSELTKTWSSGATECGVWIGNCNAKVWKSTEHKLHNIWRSLKFCTNWGKRAHPSNGLAVFTAVVCKGSIGQHSCQTTACTCMSKR